MPIPPAPRTFYCPQCGWTQRVYPRSDALRLGHDWFDRCPRCNHQPLEQRPLSKLEQVLNSLFRH